MQAGLTPGALFAHDFQVVRQLQSGGMGSVYVVLQKSTGRQRALKLMLPQLVADPALRRRFEQEARVGSLVESDHVVEVVGAGVDDASGMPWLAMELLKGEDLAAMVKRSGPVPLADVRLIMRQLCHAVGAAHAAGITHRDLKPENVFLAESKRAGETWVVKVLDFGIAKIAAEAATRHTAAMGSPIWMAPEQTDRSEIRSVADVWAIGLIAFHLFTARFFWLSAESEHATLHSVMREVVFDPLPTAAERAKQYGVSDLLPPWFDTWFSRCVVRDQDQRFTNAREAYEAFEQLADGRSSAQSSPQRPSHEEVGTTLPMGPSTPVAVPIQSAPRPKAATLNAPPLPSAAPLVTAPAVSATMNPERAQSSPSRTPIIAAGIGTIALIAIGGYAVLRHSKKQDGTGVVQAPSAETSAGVQAAAPPPPRESSTSPAQEATPPSVASLATPSASPAVTIAAKLPPAQQSPPSTGAVARDGGAQLAGNTTDKGPPPPAARKEEPPPAAAADKGTSTSSSGAPFDRGAAAAALGAVNVQSCKKPDGPTGSGRVEVTFGPDGSVFSAQVVDGPFPGTPVGGCIAGKFRGARVPAFSGAPVHVKKSFTVE